MRGFWNLWESDKGLEMGKINQKSKEKTLNYIKFLQKEEKGYSYLKQQLESLRYLYQILCFNIRMLNMNQSLRSRLVNSFLSKPFSCKRHPERLADVIIIEEIPIKGPICGLCYDHLLQQLSYTWDQLTCLSLNYLINQVNNSCNSLTQSANTCAFLDHHFNLMRQLSRKHCRSFASSVQIAVANYFQKAKDMLRGTYFQEFYDNLELIDKMRNLPEPNSEQETKAIIKIVNFMRKFFEEVIEYEGYCDLNSEEKLSGVAIVKQIHINISEKYKAFKMILEDPKKNISQEKTLQLFDPSIQKKNYQFSSQLHNNKLKINDPKKIKIMPAQDFDYIKMALIEPCIGKSKTTIKFKIDGIKGYISIGIAIRQIAECNSYIFLSQINHGSFQISYDGYSWNKDTSNHLVYTSWGFKQNDVITLTVDPFRNEMVFIRNEEKHNPNVLKYTCERRHKLHFCVSLNYENDAVTIID